jgi:glutamyl-tRNA synthetase
VESYRAAGFLPDAFVNFLALLGWSYDGVQEIFTRDELVQKFTPERMSDTPAVFDVTKLEWMNGEYLRALPVAARARLVRPVLEAAGLPVPDDAYLERVIAMVGDRLKLTRHILTYADYAFADTVTYDPEAYRKTLARDDAREGIRELLPAIEGAPEFTAAALEERARAAIAAAGRKTGDVLQPVRVALTGRLVSPGIFEVMELLGRERTLARLRAGIAAEAAAS